MNNNTITFPAVTYRRASAAQEAVVEWMTRIVQAYAAWQIIALIAQFFLPDAVRSIGLVLSVLNIPTYPSLLSAVLLVLVAAGLMRRHRAALWLFLAVFQLPVIIFTITAALHPQVTLKELLGDDLALQIGIVAAVVITGLLFWARPAFTARLAPGAWNRSVLVFVTGLAISIALAFVIVELNGMNRPLDAFAWSITAALGLPPDTFSFGAPLHGPHWLQRLCSTLTAFSLLAAISIFLGGRRHSPEADLRDELEIRRLLLTSDHEDSLGYFATRDDRSVIFAPNDKAGISYRVVNGVALAAGDPLGEKEFWPDAIAAWLDHARRFGRWPAVLSASETGAQAYRRAGLNCLTMGDEAVISVDDFNLKGPGMRPVRKAISTPKRAGYTVQVRRQRDIEPAELLQLSQLADQWRQGGDERGFSMASGRLGDGRDQRTVIVTAHDSAGSVRGLLSFVPWGRRGLSLDYMRRSRESINGVTELMVTGLVEACRELGVTQISLNFAMFRTSFMLGERIGATPAQRLVHSALVLASRWWQLQSLYRSNAKYLPEWRPRMLCYESATQLSAVLIAAGQAEGFLPEPRAFRRASTAVMPTAAAAEVAALEHELLLQAPPPQKLSEQERVRHAKLAQMRAAGIDPYPAEVPRSCAIGDLPDHGEVAIVGRIVRMRDHGGVMFVDLREGTAEYQVLLTRSQTLTSFRRWADLGDLISVCGTLTTSRSGQPSLEAESWQMAAKCLVPPPNKYLGLADPETRVRNRHIDLALNTTPMQRLQARSRAVAALRDVLHAEGYMEVETPILQTVHGGANARPFTTHINAYDTDLSLRIAPELFLKRLEIAGFPRVFEIGRNFRNEGADNTHNPEFTALEAYAAFGDYTSMRLLTQRLIVAAATALRGEASAPGPNGEVIDLSGTWRHVTVHAAVSEATGETITADTPACLLQRLCADHGITTPADATAGALVTELYEELVEPVTITPTFYLDFPVETSPLTRPHRNDPRLAERWDLVACGMELGTAYTELTDPVDQRQRFVAQSLLQAAGDAEAMEVDEEFLRALAFGMPPTGGLGLGVDRLVMFLLGANIRDTLAFPFVRPR
ncbi:MAG: bifunctional lysylphosphatidylglycerol synthetase/lysine--tRNA ligase LysX [Bowdeniella nasicola]|nr:bifunctional lysylphosphatidylglycerol synthetase/lysine--tRNA ligase LysX [Bowdeniella nasicola]